MPLITDETVTSYTSLATMKATLELTGETFADPDITLAITAASRSIDNLCRRRFYPDADATSVRYYTPDDCRQLKIDDLVTLTSVQTDTDGDGAFEDTWTENTDFILEPLNAAEDGWPWTTLTVHPSGPFRFPEGMPRSVKVTGKFGWTEAPDAVQEAATVLTSKLMRRAREAPFGVVMAGMEGAAMRIARHDPDVLMLVGPYMRSRISAA